MRAQLCVQSLILLPDCGDLTATLTAGGGDQDIGINYKILQALEMVHYRPVRRIATPPGNKSLALQISQNRVVGPKR